MTQQVPVDDVALAPDREAARQSMPQPAAPEPERAVAGHGPAMQGPAMREAVHKPARDFDRVAVPEAGRHVGHGARPDDGSADVPP